MKKAILVFGAPVIYAITEDNLVYMHKLDMKIDCGDIYQSDMVIFKNIEKYLFDELQNLEFKIDNNSFFSIGDGPYIRLMESLTGFNLNNKEKNFNEIVNFWGDELYTGMGTTVIGLRVQYIKINKPLITKKLKIYDTEENWKFTFSTYKDDLNTLSFNEALDRLNRKYERYNLKTKYSNEDLIKMIDYIKKERKVLISAKNKIERNMLDYKDPRSMYVRLDKDFISDKDVIDAIENFKEKRYTFF